MVILHFIFCNWDRRYNPRYNLHEETGPRLQGLREDVLNSWYYQLRTLVPLLANPGLRLWRYVGVYGWYVGFKTSSLPEVYPLV